MRHRSSHIAVVNNFTMGSAASICGKQVLLSSPAELVCGELELVDPKSEKGPVTTPKSSFVIEVSNVCDAHIFKTVIVPGEDSEDVDEEEAPLTTVGDLRTALGHKLREVARSYEHRINQEIEHLDRLDECDHWCEMKGAEKTR